MFTFEYMENGNVTVAKMEAERLFPVMAKIQEKNLPYIVKDESDRTIFSYNKEYVKAHQPMTWTLAYKLNGVITKKVYVNLVQLSIDTCTVNASGAQWCIFRSDDPKKIWRSGNLQPKPVLPDPAPAPKAGAVAPSDFQQVSENELDKMNDAVNDVMAEESVPTDTANVDSSVDLIEDDAFLDQDPDGQYHIVRVDNKLLNGYIDMSFSTKEKVYKHFNALKAAYIAMLTYTHPDKIGEGGKHVFIKLFNRETANKELVVEATLNILKLFGEQAETSSEIDEIIDEYISQFHPENACFFEEEYLTIKIGNSIFYIRDEYVRTDSMMLEYYGCTEKEEWRRVYVNEEDANAYNDEYIYKGCVAKNM